MDQFKAIENGDISDYEMEATKNSLVTDLKSMQDSQGAMLISISASTCQIRMRTWILS